MKEISKLAKNFRSKSSEEAQRISRDLESGLEQLESVTATALKSSEQNLLAALSESEKVMSAAIQRQRKAQLLAYRWPLILLTVLALALSGWSAWQVVEIRQQRQAIAQGKRTLASLPSNWRVERISGKSYLIKTSRKRPDVLTIESEKNTWYIQME